MISHFTETSFGSSKHQILTNPNNFSLTHSEVTRPRDGIIKSYKNLNLHEGSNTP